MATEIIKKGRSPYTKYQGTCDHCECVFTFQEDDIFKRELWKNERYAIILCPNCKRYATVSMEGVKIIEL